MFDLAAEGLVVGAQPAAQLHHEESGGGHHDQEEGQELGYPHPDDDEPAHQRDDGAEAHVGALLDHLLHGLDITDDLGLENARTDPRVIADGELLHTAAERRAQGRARSPDAAAEQPDVPLVERVVDHEDEQQDARGLPYPRFGAVLDDHVEDGGGDQWQQPDRAVLHDEDGDRDGQ